MKTCDQCNHVVSEREFPSHWEFNGKVWCRECLEKARKVRQTIEAPDGEQVMRDILQARVDSIKCSTGGHMIPDCVAIETAKIQLTELLVSMLEEKHPGDTMGEDV